MEKDLKQLTKSSTSAEIKQYFKAILKLSESNEDFPVNLDEIWMLVYERKDKAVEVLKKDFLQLPENESFHEKGERSDYDYMIVKERVPAGHTVSIKENYLLSVPCLEFFIARKVRDVFEVYRQVFHKTAKQIENKEKPIPPRTLQLMKLDTAKWLLKTLNYSDTAKLALAEAVAGPLDLPTPIYAESKGVVHSAKYHLDLRGIKLSSEKFNKIMIVHGLAERASRYSRTKGKTVTWQVLCNDGLLYGQNDVHPKDPRETQPNYFDDKFDELLEKLGINAKNTGE